MADNERDKNRPDYVIDEAACQIEEMRLVRDLAAGTLRLREMGVRYLPIEPAERTDDHRNRVARAILYNAFDRTLHALVGMVFRKDPQFCADVPAAIAGVETVQDGQPMHAEGIGENIDRAGNHWAVFSKELFACAMRDGHAFVFVDMPPPLPDGATRADEIAANRRPYWVRYEKDQALNWRFSDGKLAQITFVEKTCEPDGDFGEVDVVRYRVLRPGSWQLWKEVKDEKGNRAVIPDPDTPEGQTSLDEIPVAVVYGRKCRPLVSRPPLLDMAVVNIAHWQKYSDYSTYLHLCSRPLWVFIGLLDSLDIKTFGAHSIQMLPQGADAKVVETSGAALGAAREDLKDLEDIMAKLGLSVLAEKTPNSTATEALLSSVREDSDLATAARSLQDCLELALKWTAQYLGPTATTGGSVEMGATMEEMTLSAQEIQAYSQAVAANQLSLETMWAVLAQAGRLPEDFNADEEARRIEQARAQMQAQAASAGAAGLAALDRGFQPPPQ